MKKNYYEPVLNVYDFATEDILTTSGTDRVTTNGLNHSESEPSGATLFNFSDFK